MQMRVQVGSWGAINSKAFLEAGSGLDVELTRLRLEGMKVLPC